MRKASQLLRVHSLTHWLLVAALAAACSGLGASPARAEAPNLVVFIADDWGLDAGCYDNPVVQTPAVDALAERAVVFDNAYAAVASCSPSRATMLTGLHTHANGAYGLQHNRHNYECLPGVVGLPKRLSELGYTTYRVGKLHVGPDASFPFDHVAHAPARQPSTMIEAIGAQLHEHGDGPFFAYIATMDPHRGPNIAKELPERPNRFGNPAPADRAASDTTYDPAEVIVPAYLPDTPACRAELAQYYESVSRVDRALGELVELLDDLGVADNTYVVVTSDHGPPFPGAKTTLYEPGLRVPMMVAGPGVGAGRRDALIGLLDLTPTLLELAGSTDAADGDAFHGKSFAGQLHDADAPSRKFLAASHTTHEVTMYYPMRSYRDARYKLIWNLAHPLEFPFAMDLWWAATWRAQRELGPDAPYGVRTVAQIEQRPEFELYDLEADPDERDNLAGDPLHAETLAEYQQRMRDWQEATDDPWLLKWERE